MYAFWSNRDIYGRMGGRERKTERERDRERTEREKERRKQKYRKGRYRPRGTENYIENNEKQIEIMTKGMDEAEQTTNSTVFPPNTIE